VTHITDAELKEAQERAAKSETMSMCCPTKEEDKECTAPEQPLKRQKTISSHSTSTQKHVMHSEIHAAVRALMSKRLRSSSIVRDLPLQDSHCWIVELDGIGVGYEEAIPCAMCNMGLIRLGISDIYYSCHEGVRMTKRTPSRRMGCVSLEMALIAAASHENV
jgi:deoxycytidylate deaminase